MISVIVFVLRFPPRPIVDPLDVHSSAGVVDQWVGKIRSKNNNVRIFGGLFESAVRIFGGGKDF